MPDEDSRLALRTADQAPIDFVIIEDELEAIYARLTRLPEPRAAMACLPFGMLGT
jgi:hypothetical protein